MYPLIKKIMFRLNAETSHHLTLSALQFAYRLRLSSLLYPAIHSTPQTIMGLQFPHHVGLAAGLDKNGDYIDALASLGFAFIEIGTITPKPQLGNPKPRLYRLIKEEAIINRMGFNNKGIDHALSRLSKMKYKGILGINIGKNAITPNDRAIDDYIAGFRAFWKYASYITINISSPNTQGLRDLQQEDAFANLLHVMKQEQLTVLRTYEKYIPLAVKISPDLSREEIEMMCKIMLREKIDAVIATNTAIARDGVVHAASGGLSGKPLQARSTRIIKTLHEFLQDNIPIIAAGGVIDAQSARDKIANGAKLVQIYSGLIYKGPALIREAAHASADEYLT